MLIGLDLDGRDSCEIRCTNTFSSLVILYMILGVEETIISREIVYMDV